MCMIFFFKQKTAYEVRISDWSSDVCSSDLMVEEVDQQIGVASARAEMDVADPNRAIAAPLADDALRHMRVGGEGIGKARRDRQGRDRGHVAKSGSASGRARVCQIV